MFFESFADFDYAIASFFHSFAEATGGKLNLLFRAITILGDKGLILILISAILLLFKKTRKTGSTALIALAIGAILTNVILKNAIFRARPFEDATSEYYDWWLFTGSLFEDKSSFPSGHSTAAMAFGLSFFLTMDKRWSWSALILTLLIGLSRIYFSVHYASDVLFGFINGAIGATASFFLFDWLYAYMLRHAENKFVKFWFSFSIIDLFRKKESST
ncbi:MAG: phosphatase PAP2 family protein [Clostridia bacterium]|nr:phosphatase PAP2 family protein [Clostridia bacterium]